MKITEPFWSSDLEDHNGNRISLGAIISCAQWRRAIKAARAEGYSAGLALIPDKLQIGDVAMLVGLVRRYSEDHDYHYGGNEEGCVCSICSDARPLLARLPK